MRLAGQAKGGYYPTPPKVTDYITTMAAPRPSSGKPNSVIKMLDPCCGPGEALAQLAESVRVKTTIKIQTYGVELHHERSVAAADTLDTVLSSDIFNTSISNNAFQVLFLNPPYDHDSGPDSNRMEHSFLTYCTKYLSPYGLLILIIPQSRLHTSARYLAAQYHGITIFRFPQPEFQAFSQVVLMGTKSLAPSPNPRIENSIHQAADNPNLRELSVQTETNYTIHDSAQDSAQSDIYFHTRLPNPVASATEAQAHGLWAHHKTTDLLWPPHTDKTRPLMPLRKGHMAMLIAAGFLNNLALSEPNGNTVLVKGTTTKEDYIAEETETSTVYRQRVTATIITLDMNTGEVQEIKA